MRVLLAAVAALLLSGCWHGANLYGAADSVRVIPPGVYRGMMTPMDRTPLTIRLTPLPNGMMRLQGAPSGDDRVVELGVRPLPGRPGLFMTWVEAPDGRDIMYAVLRPETDGSFTWHMPDCSLTEETLQAVGVEPTHEAVMPSCVFPSRATVEEALRRYSDRLDRWPPVHFTRLSNG